MYRTTSSLAKFAYGAFADKGSVSGGKRRGFCRLAPRKAGVPDKC